MSIFRRISAFLLAHKYYSIAGLIVIAVIGGAIWRMSSSDTTAETSRGPREVTVARVADIMNGGSSLSVVGEVQSKNEAKISTEASGRITRVNVSLGSNVGAGAILAEIENSSQSAAVLQAEGAFDAAKASVPNLESSLESAKGSAVSTLLTAYASVESAIRDAVDPLLALPNSSTPTFNVVTTTDSQSRSALENTRSQLGLILVRHKAQASAISKNSDLKAELEKTSTEVRQVRNYIDLLLKALNAGVVSPNVSESDLATYKSEAASARTSVTTSLSAITSAQSALEVAENNTSGSVSSSAASQKQAEGAYNAALANLEKTRIRAPISGTVNNFSIKLGDTVSPGQEVAVVSNNGALEIVASVTEEDRTRIAVGGKVSIEGGFDGTITKIAPALDPSTHKIEIRIGLSADATKKLVNGQSVRVELTQKTTTSAVAGPIRIPIAALKMESDRSIVFAVNASSTLVALPVKVGALTGNYIEVGEGLTAETEIVTDARGLKDGGAVKIQYSNSNGQTNSDN